jgi:hypothetical protein
VVAVVAATGQRADEALAVPALEALLDSPVAASPKWRPLGNLLRRQAQPPRIAPATFVAPAAFVASTPLCPLAPHR